jgi:hypothetical protein
MRLDLDKKPQGEWASFNEGCGTGDGTTLEFKVPFPPADARSLLVLRDFAMVLPDNRLVEKNELDGTILKDEPDGYRLEERNGELLIVFDRPPAFDVRVSVSSLGRQVGDAFKILPMSTVLQKKIQEKQPASLRGRDRNAVSVLDLQEAGRVSFMELVVDWTGITDGADKPLPCDTENKKLFLDQKDAMFFGLFVSNRSAAIRAERINEFAKDSSD